MLSVTNNPFMLSVGILNIIIGRLDSPLHCKVMLVFHLTHSALMSTLKHINKKCLLRRYHPLSALPVCLSVKY
jgi:hypothetical protein